MQKYSLNQCSIETLLTLVKSGEIAITRIQSHFVCDNFKKKYLYD